MLSESEFKKRLIFFREKTAKISSNSLISGRHPSKFLGLGDNMKDYGEYDPAIHAIEDIDFVLSASEPDGKLRVRYFFDEEVRPTFVVIDTTKSMYFGDKLDIALLSAWFLAISLVVDGPVYLMDGKDLTLSAVKSVPQASLKSGIAEFRKNYEAEVDSISRDILGLKTALRKTESKTSNFSYADLTLLNKKNRKSNLFVISDFISNEDFSDIFKKLKSAGFSVFAVITRDKEEEGCPVLGALDAVDPESESLSSVRLYGRISEIDKTIREKNEALLVNLARSSAIFVKIAGIEEVLIKIRTILKKVKKI